MATQEVLHAVASALWEGAPRSLLWNLVVHVAFIFRGMRFPLSAFTREILPVSASLGSRPTLISSDSFSR